VLQFIVRSFNPCVNTWKSASILWCADWWNGNIALAVAVIGCAPLSMAADTAGTPIGKQVGDFSLPDFHGQPHSLSQYQDRAVVLAFLGTECPLVKSMPRGCATWPRVRAGGRGVFGH